MGVTLFHGHVAWVEVLFHIDKRLYYETPTPTWFIKWLFPKLYGNYRDQYKI